MAETVGFKRSSCLTWKMKNPFSGCHLESDIFTFDGSQWKFSLHYSNMMDCFPFILRKIDSEERHCAFEFELFVQTDDKKLQRVNSDHFTVFDCSPVTVWLPSRNFIRQLSSVLGTNNVWTFLFVLTSTIPRIEEEPACKCREKDKAPVLESRKTEGKNMKELESSDSTLACVESLIIDLRRLLDEGSLSDVELTCGELTISAHRNILSARSEVFAAMLRTDMAENRTGVIEILDMEVPIFKQFAHFLYTGKLEDLSVETVQQLYMAGDKYAIESLKIRCSDFIRENLAEDNACSILVLADVYNDKDLKDYVIAFVMREELPKKDNIWIPFCEHHPKLAIEIVRLAYKDKCELK